MIFYSLTQKPIMFLQNPIFETETPRASQTFHALMFQAALFNLRAIIPTVFLLFGSAMVPTTAET